MIGEADLEKEAKTEVWFWGICILGVLAGLVFVTTIFRAAILAEHEDGLAGTLGTGVFGDAFGFVTCMFTGLAFAGLVLTMRLQRAELAATNLALGDQKETNAKLIDQARIQRLEDRFFTLSEIVRVRAMEAEDEYRGSGVRNKVNEIFSSLSQAKDLEEIDELVFGAGANGISYFLRKTGFREFSGAVNAAMKLCEHSDDNSDVKDQFFILLGAAVPSDLSGLFCLGSLQILIAGNGEVNDFETAAEWTHDERSEYQHEFTLYCEAKSQLASLLVADKFRY